MATRAINSIDAMYQPMMVIGWATEKETRRAMFRSRDMFDIKAKTREMALIAMSLTAHLYQR